MKILLFGRNGQVAWELRRTLSVLGKVHSLERPELELSAPDALRSVIRDCRPDLLVNAAAYTAVDQAESEPELAMRINAVAPGVMADEMKRIGGLFVTYSTDFVYDGSKSGPYTEVDAVNPINVYGRSKALGDQAVVEVGGSHFIFRTSWVHGARGRNFLRTMLRLASSGKTLRVVDDQVGTPTWARDLATATTMVLSRLNANSNTGLSLAAAAKEISGIYHMTGSGEVSWHGFASAIVREGVRLGLLCSPAPEVLPIPTDQYPTPARRPANSRLSGKKLADIFGLSLPDWHDSLLMVLGELSEFREAGGTVAANPVSAAGTKS